MNGGWVEEVVLAIVPPLVTAASGQGVPIGGAHGEGILVAAQHFLGQHGQGHALQAGGCAHEITVDDALVQAQRLENLRPAIALDGGDAHLGQHFDDAFNGRLDIFLGSLLIRNSRDQLLVQQIAQRLEGQVGVDGIGAVAEQNGEVMHLAGVARFEDEAGFGALAFADEVVVQARAGQQGGDGSQLGVDASVGQNEQIGAVVNGAVGRREQCFQRIFEGWPIAIDIVEQGQRLRLESIELNVAQLSQLLVRQQGVFQHDAPRMVGGWLEQVAFCAQQRLCARHQLFADGINGRVGHLGEQLLEVVVDGLAVAGKHGRWRVVAHRTQRFHACFHHRGQHHPQILEGVAKRLLSLGDGGRVGLGDAGGGGHIVEGEQVFIEPLLERPFVADDVLQFFVADDALFRYIYQQHAPRLEPPLVDHVLGFDIQHAHFGGQNQVVVFGDVVAGGAQAVAVQNRPDEGSVGETNGGGAVPRLHQATVVLVEGAFFGGKMGVFLPRLGHGHHHHIGEGVAREVEKLNGVVEHARVTAVAVYNGQDFGQIVAELLAGE